MHVGVNARTFAVDSPGGEVQAAIRLVRAMATRDDIELTLFGHDSLASAFPDLSLVSTGIPVDSQPLGIVWESVVLPRLADGHDVDVLFCPTSNGPVRASPVPVVVCIHDLFAYEGDADGLYGRVQRVRIPRMVSHADSIVTVSEYSKGRLVDAFDLPQESVAVVYNGVDERFHGDRPGEKIDVPDPYLLFVGGMNERKNFRGLLAAFDELQSSFDIAHELVVAGPSEKRIYATVNEGLDRDDVTHLGFVSERELKYLYDNADAFLFPSLREGFGIPPLEAMACGTPVVSSDRPCMPEVLDDAAAFADPTDEQAFADAVYEVLSNPDRREDLVERGRRHAAEFTWDRAASEMIGVLRTVA